MSLFDWVLSFSHIKLFLPCPLCVFLWVMAVKSPEASLCLPSLRLQFSPVKPQSPARCKSVSDPHNHVRLFSQRMSHVPRRNNRGNRCERVLLFNETHSTSLCCVNQKDQYILASITSSCIGFTLISVWAIFHLPWPGWQIPLVH